MTTDDFTRAARAEILSRLGHEAQRFDGGKRVTAFVGGAEWARTYLAAQDPTDAEWENEVAAALPERYDGDEDQRDIILRAVRDMAARETQEPTDAEAIAYLAAFVEDLPPGAGDDWTPDTIAHVKRGLRAARRDEEKR